MYSSRGPPTIDRKLGVHASAERSGNSGQGVGIREPRAGMHSHPRACSRPDRPAGARYGGLTERGSLAGPGPKLTTCIRESMVRKRELGVCWKRPIAWAAQVCSRRRLRAFFQRRAGAPIGPRCRWPCADWFAQRGSHPHWSCSPVETREQLLLLAFTVSTHFDQCKARGRLHQPGGSAARPPENLGRREEATPANLRWCFCTLHEALSSPPTRTLAPLSGLHWEMAE